MEGEVKGKTYKMKGHTLPGINQRSEGNTDLPDGRSKSSTFQQDFGMAGMIDIARGMTQNVQNPNVQNLGVSRNPTEQSIAEFHGGSTNPRKKRNFWGKSIGYGTQQV